VLVNEAAARRLWPGANPLGKRVRPLFHATPSLWEPIPDASLAWLTVAGVVGNTLEGGPVDRDPAELYFSYRQLPSPFVFLVVRTAQEPGSVAPAVRHEILALDRDQPVSDVRTMDSAIQESLAAPWLNARLAGIFVLLAVFLSAVGVYGVMSYAVNGRTQTIAIHMALGARDVELMVLGEAGRIAAAAACAGLLSGIWLAQAMKSLLYGMAPNDPLIFVGACVLLFVVALAACYVPARRAARVDPMAAMRVI
jgi:putative ABC transport system permease protein